MFAFTFVGPMVLVSLPATPPAGTASIVSVVWPVAVSLACCDGSVLTEGVTVGRMVSVSLACCDGSVLAEGVDATVVTVDSAVVTTVVVVLLVVVPAVVMPVVPPRQ
jgi:hypothetical protein